MTMKTQFHKPHPQNGGFSAIELVLTVVVLAILMGVVKMRSSSLLERSKITKITQTVDTAKSACVLFHTDTSQYAKQGGPSNQLRSSELPGWNGPYFEGSDLDQSNPFGELRIDNTHTGFGMVTGWDIDCDGKQEITGPCNVVFLSGIDQETAEKLDTYYDPSKGADWEKVGRFQYIASSQNGLIFLYQ